MVSEANKTMCSALIVAALLMAATGPVLAGGGHAAAPPDLASDDGEISFSFALGARGPDFRPDEIEVKLIHRRCMGNVLYGGWLLPGRALKGPLSEGLPTSGGPAECHDWRGDAEWQVTVWEDGRVSGACTIGYARYRDGRRYVFFGRLGGNGSPWYGESAPAFCPITVRATCNADGDSCWHRDATGRGPVRIEFAPIPIATVLIEKGGVTPF